MILQDSMSNTMLSYNKKDLKKTRKLSPSALQKLKQEFYKKKFTSNFSLRQFNIG